MVSGDSHGRGPQGLLKEHRIPHKQHWKIRMTKDEFKPQLSQQQKHSLFFHKAAKRNPGVAGAGGIIYDLGGTRELSYEWGLGKATNNQAEASALLQGIKVAISLNARAMHVFGDSSIIIQFMHSNKSPKDNKLARIKEEPYKIQEIQFLHILRTLNKEADTNANGASRLEEGMLKQNGVVNCFAIPQVYIQQNLCMTIKFTMQAHLVKRYGFKGRRDETFNQALPPHMFELSAFKCFKVMEIYLADAEGILGSVPRLGIEASQQAPSDLGNIDGNGQHPTCQRDIPELCKVLQQHEYITNGNRTGIFSVTSKVHVLEHQQVSQNAIIMDTLAQKKREIQALEEECVTL